ncbi:MAG: tripartite tricarboxylate transporter substrate binding protein, partial [Deltaproteobacteria bacterium]|nr:tripartite tricarboxylate transporter substrate binding protein [Deltaproteobacteria bacterium]
MSRRRIPWLSLAVVVLFVLVATQAWAADKPKDYPNKPVTIQIGFGAGGSSDVGVRLLAESLKKVIGQPVLAENKPGAGGQVMWTDFKNNAKPDGYTLALINVPQLQTVVFDASRKPLFTMKDFQPVANHVQDPGAILVRKESPYKTLEDLLADAKARPGQVKASTTGIGSDDHLALLDVQRQAKVTFNIIHLKDTPTAMTRVLGGHTDVNFDNVGGFLPSVESGLARILAVMMEKRYPDLPNVPTLLDLVKNEQDRQIATLVTLPVEIGYNYWVAPE